MARQGLSRPAGYPVLRDLVPHHRWDPDRWTGVMELTLETLPGRFVAPGTGRLALFGEPPGEIVAQRAEHSNDLPVLPGSGIKGAVRTLFELLSFSCNPFSGGCRHAGVCDACSLFGTLGYAGRVSFADAVPASSGAVRAEVRRLPVGHEPDAEKTKGEFRLYDLAPGGSPARGAPAPATAAREVYRGRFRTRLSFVNATGEELGRLLLCLGLAGEGAAGFPLRLGGVKYEGQGAVRAAVESLTVRMPRPALPAIDARERVAGWIAEAVRSDWGTAFLPTYEQLATALNHGEGAR